MTIKESSLTVTTSEIYLDIDPPKGSYKLDNGGLTPFVAATLLNPRPDGERPAHSRYNFTSSYIPYVVPIHLMGGSPPYNFVFDCDIPGAFLYRKYGNIPA